MSDPVFEVTYRVGIGNLNAFFGAWWKRTRFDKVNWKRLGLYALGIEAMMLFATWPTLTSQIVAASFFDDERRIILGILELTGSLVLALPLVFAVGPALTYAVQLATFTFGPMRRRVSHMRATTAGIDKTTGDIASQTKWRDFTGIVVTRKTVLLFTNRNCAAIVPKSAFASPAEAEAFAAFATAQWAEAQSVF